MQIRLNSAFGNKIYPRCSKWRREMAGASLAGGGGAGRKIAWTHPWQSMKGRQALKARRGRKITSPGLLAWREGGLRGRGGFRSSPRFCGSRRPRPWPGSCSGLPWWISGVLRPERGRRQRQSPGPARFHGGALARPLPPSLRSASSASFSMHWPREMPRKGPMRQSPICAGGLSGRPPFFLPSPAGAPTRPNSPRSRLRRSLSCAPGSCDTIRPACG